MDYHGALAMKHLESMGRLASAFLWLRPAVVARSVDYPDILAEYAPGAAATDDSRLHPLLAQVILDGLHPEAGGARSTI
jgi:hypothetical protein